MHPFATYVLRSYYKATGWNEDNLYANLTRASHGQSSSVIRSRRSAHARPGFTALLDFTVPRGLHFSISKSPNALFRTTYAMDALPSLHGSVGYIFTSCELDVQNSRNVLLKDMVERFKVYSQPQRPEGKPEEWLAGERVDTRGAYACSVVVFPVQIDALYSTVRLSALRSALHPHREGRRSILCKAEPECASLGSCHLRSSFEFVLCGKDARS